jgi:hypothetical protein
MNHNHRSKSIVLLAMRKSFDIAVFTVPRDSAAHGAPLNFAPGSS